MTLWAGIVAVIGTIGMVIAGLFAARATTRAAAATAEATQAAARVSVGPNERAEDRAAFETIKTELRAELTTARDEVRSLRVLVRSLALYVDELTGVMRRHRIDPPSPPPRVDEYNRTGV